MMMSLLFIILSFLGQSLTAPLAGNLSGKTLLLDAQIAARTICGRRTPVLHGCG